MRGPSSILSLLLPILICRAPVLKAEEPALLRIAFGSCAKQNEPQPIWDVIGHQNPDLFLFIGDCVYADTNVPEELQQALGNLAEIPEFARFRERCSIYATWDDHDFGLNDSGGEHPQKKAAMGVFLDFFRVPMHSPLRNQDGVYQVILKSTAGFRVQILLLDTRYNRSPLKSFMVAGHTLYVPNPDPTTTMLGEAQWNWLESELAVPNMDVRILVSSIQVIPDDHPGEKWSNLPIERDRLLRLLDGASGTVVILSGDQHLAEFSELTLASGAQLMEFTSSGLTHTRENIPAINQHRKGKPMVKKNFGIVDVRREDRFIQIDLKAVDENGLVGLVQQIKTSGSTIGAKE